MMRGIVNSFRLQRSFLLVAHGITLQHNQEVFPLIFQDYDPYNNSKERGMEICSSDLLSSGSLNSNDREIADRIMSIVEGSSLDTSEMRKVKEKSKMFSSYMTMLTFQSHLMIFQARMSCLMLLSPSIRKQGHLRLLLENDDSIVLTFPFFSSMFSNPRVVVLSEGLLFLED